MPPISAIATTKGGAVGGVLPHDGTRHVVVTVLVLSVLFWLIGTGDFRLRTAERHGVITEDRPLGARVHVLTHPSGVRARAPHGRSRWHTWAGLSCSRTA